MINTNRILKALKKNKTGLSLTDLVKNTTLSRGQIRTAIAFLLGARLVTEKQVGMAKLYFINDENPL